MSPNELLKLANEADLIANGRVSSVKIIMWAEDNGALIAELARAAAHPPLSVSPSLEVER